MYLSSLLESLDCDSIYLISSSVNTADIPKLLILKKITKEILRCLGLKKVKIIYSGGKRGWPGDVFKVGGSLFLVVDGEEDLLALPSILFAPLNAYVLYGQPNEGIVVVSVTESLKIKVQRAV